MPDLILVHRLRDAYYPEFVRSYVEHPHEVLHAPIQRHYETALRLRTAAWHGGRIRYFYMLFKNGLKVDPIDIDNEAFQYRVGSPVSWGGPFIDDGHHRFAAALLAGKRKIWANLSGLVTTHEWLRGLRKYTPLPEELTC